MLSLIEGKAPNFAAMPWLLPIWNDWLDSQAFPGTDFKIASRAPKWREAIRLLTSLKISTELGASASVKGFLQQ